MNKNEVIVDLGAEGGSVTLYGFRTERGWLFESSRYISLGQPFPTLRPP